MRLSIWAAAVMIAGLCSSMNVKASPALRAAGFDDLQGWSNADHAKAYRSLILSCDKILNTAKGFSATAKYAGKKSDWSDLCRYAMSRRSLSSIQARSFLETHFQPVSVDPDKPGLFTGYYEPEVAGSRSPSTDYPVAVYRKPANLVRFNKSQQKSTGLKYGRLVGGKPQPYLTRRQIESGGLAGEGLELVWLKSWADAFFMQVQGSGRVRLTDGKVMHLGFAAKTGLPYTAIGAVLIEWNEVSRADMSMQAIRAWMDDNPDRARQLMWHNESFVFFQPITLPDRTLGPVGAHGVQLQAGHSLAIDRRYWAYGTPMWLETKLPEFDGEPVQDLHQLMIAQDTGSAIKGLLRGDIFFGAGRMAEMLAGNMQSTGRLFALLPRKTVRRLGIGE